MFPQYCQIHYISLLYFLYGKRKVPQLRLLDKELYKIRCWLWGCFPIFCHNPWSPLPPPSPHTKTLLYLSFLSQHSHSISHYNSVKGTIGAIMYKHVNIWCVAHCIYECICRYLVNLTPNTINADEYLWKWITIIGFSCVWTKLYCIILSCIKHLSIYCWTICIVIVIIMHHNVLITSYL